MRNIFFQYYRLNYMINTKFYVYNIYNIYIDYLTLLIYNFSSLESYIH